MLLLALAHNHAGSRRTQKAHTHPGQPFPVSWGSQGLLSKPAACLAHYASHQYCLGRFLKRGKRGRSELSLLPTAGCRTPASPFRQLTTALIAHMCNCASVYAWMTAVCTMTMSFSPLEYMLAKPCVPVGKQQAGRLHPRQRDCGGTSS